MERTGMVWQVLAGTTNIPPPVMVAGTKGEESKGEGFASVVGEMEVLDDLMASASCLRCSRGTRR